MIKGWRFFFLSNRPQLSLKSEDDLPLHNSPVHVLYRIIDAIMSSAQEEVSGTAFINAREAIFQRLALEEMGHKQGSTPLQLDNRCTKGILTDEFHELLTPPCWLL